MDSNNPAESFAPTSVEWLQKALADLPRHGTLVKDHGHRQVWRFEYEGTAHYLKFYPRRGGHLKRSLRGSPAVREFIRLQWLQKASIAAPRGTAVLVGYRLNGVFGDALIMNAIEPSITLDRYLNALQIQGRPAPDHRALVAQVTDLCYELAHAGYGHGDLHLGNFLLHKGKLYLLDAYAVRRKGMRDRDLLRLGHSARRYATQTDIHRAWSVLGGNDKLPARNPVSARIWNAFMPRIAGESRTTGRLRQGAWSGLFFKAYKYPYRWSSISQMSFTAAQWSQVWPDLLKRLEGGALKVLKSSRSGEVLEAELAMGDRTISAIIKRPRRRYWYRYFNEIGRGARARRAWFKAWSMIIRNVPTAWPLLLMERRRLGYVVDTIIVFEKIDGPTLATIDLPSMEGAARDMLFHRTGRLLRLIERLGFSHFDAKSSNFIVWNDPLAGPTPLLIDIDGIRHRRWIALGVQRLLRSMREHAGYTPADSLALCIGYAPRAGREKVGSSEEKVEKK